jgi:hypothetical protein
MDAKTRGNFRLRETLQVAQDNWRAEFFRKTVDRLVYHWFEVAPGNLLLRVCQLLDGYRSLLTFSPSVPRSDGIKGAVGRQAMQPTANR